MIEHLVYQRRMETAGELRLLFKSAPTIEIAPEALQHLQPLELQEIQSDLAQVGGGNLTPDAAKRLRIRSEASPKLAAALRESLKKVAKEEPALISESLRRLGVGINKTLTTDQLADAQLLIEAQTQAVAEATKAMPEVKTEVAKEIIAEQPKTLWEKGEQKANSFMETVNNMSTGQKVLWGMATAGGLYLGFQLLKNIFGSGEEKSKGSKNWLLIPGLGILGIGLMYLYERYVKGNVHAVAAITQKAGEAAAAAGDIAQEAGKGAENGFDKTKKNFAAAFGLNPEELPDQNNPDLQEKRRFLEKSLGEQATIVMKGSVVYLYKQGGELIELTKEWGPAMYTLIVSEGSTWREFLEVHAQGTAIYALSFGAIDMAILVKQFGLKGATLKTAGRSIAWPYQLYKKSGAQLAVRTVTGYLPLGETSRLNRIRAALTFREIRDAPGAVIDFLKFGKKWTPEYMEELFKEWRYYNSQLGLVKNANDAHLKQALNFKQRDVMRQIKKGLEVFQKRGWSLPDFIKRVGNKDLAAQIGASVKKGKRFWFFGSPVDTIDPNQIQPDLLEDVLKRAHTVSEGAEAAGQAGGATAEATAFTDALASGEIGLVDEAATEVAATTQAALAPESMARVSALAKTLEASEATVKAIEAVERAAPEFITALENSKLPAAAKLEKLLVYVELLASHGDDAAALLKDAEFIQAFLSREGNWLINKLLLSRISQGAEGIEAGLQIFAKWSKRLNLVAKGGKYTLAGLGILGGGLQVFEGIQDLSQMFALFSTLDQMEEAGIKLQDIQIASLKNIRNYKAVSGAANIVGGGLCIVDGIVCFAGGAGTIGSFVVIAPIAAVAAWAGYQIRQSEIELQKITPDEQLVYLFNQIMQKSPIQALQDESGLNLADRWEIWHGYIKIGEAGFSGRKGYDEWLKVYERQEQFRMKVIDVMVLQLLLARGINVPMKQMDVGGTLKPVPDIDQYAGMIRNYVRAAIFSETGDIGDARALTIGEIPEQRLLEIINEAVDFMQQRIIVERNKKSDGKSLDAKVAGTFTSLFGKSLTETTEEDFKHIPVFDRLLDNRGVLRATAPSFLKSYTWTGRESLEAQKYRKYLANEEADKKQMQNEIWSLRKKLNPTLQEPAKKPHELPTIRGQAKYL